MLPKQPNQSVVDGIRCLQIVAQFERPAGVSEVAARAGLEVTRAHRLLRTLAHTGFLSYTSNRKYTVGAAISVMAAQFMHASPLVRNSLGPLQALSKSRKHSVVAMGMLWEKSVSYIYHANPNTPLEAALGGHHYWPASRSGLGVALLAQQDDTIIKEWYRGDEEIPGFSSFTKLMQEVRKTRKRGFSEHDTQTGRVTIAKVLPSYPNAAIGISAKGKSQAELDYLIGPIDQCIESIEASILAKD